MKFSCSVLDGSVHLGRGFKERNTIPRSFTFSPSHSLSGSAAIFSTHLSPILYSSVPWYGLVFFRPDCWRDRSRSPLQIWIYAPKSCDRSLNLPEKSECHFSLIFSSKLIMISLYQELSAIIQSRMTNDNWSMWIRVIDYLIWKAVPVLEQYYIISSFKVSAELHHNRSG